MTTTIFKSVFIEPHNIRPQYLKHAERFYTWLRVGYGWHRLLDRQGMLRSPFMTIGEFTNRAKIESRIGLLRGVDTDGDF